MLFPYTIIIIYYFIFCSIILPPFIWWNKDFNLKYIIVSESENYQCHNSVPSTVQYRNKCMSYNSVQCRRNNRHYGTAWGHTPCDRLFPCPPEFLGTTRSLFLRASYRMRKWQLEDMPVSETRVYSNTQTTKVTWFCLNKLVRKF